MAYKDLREFIGLLEKENELLKVPLEVDWQYEVSGWIWKSSRMGDKGPALLFEKLKGYPPGYRLFADGISTYQRFALALGLPKDTSPREIINFYRERIKKPIPPKIVATGPVKENILLGEDVDMLKFPVPWWLPRDGGRYIGTWFGVITKDPETGIANMGMYRIMVHDKRHAGVGFLPFRHLGHHYAQCERKNKPLEMAVVIGGEEIIPMASGTNAPPGVDEMAIAGALRGEPMELVKCETVDLEVPATAEIVLEGLLLPRERRPEGPFGEHPGYHGGPVRMRPVFQVNAILHRHNPIFRGSLLGKPVQEDHILDDIAHSAAALDMFASHGPEGVTAVHCPPEGDSAMSMVIAMKPHYIGHSRDVGRTLISSNVGKSMKLVVVVDDDIDPFDLGQVWWAIVTRTQGGRDIEVLHFGPISRSDPSVPRDQGEYTDKVIIDATKKLDYPYDRNWGGHWAPTAMPLKETIRLAEMKWQKLVGQDASFDKEIEALTKEFETKIFKKWEDWRKKAYAMSEAEQAAEISRSYPILEEDEI